MAVTIQFSDGTVLAGDLCQPGVYKIASDALANGVPADISSVTVQNGNDTVTYSYPVVTCTQQITDLFSGELYRLLQISKGANDVSSTDYGVSRLAELLLSDAQCVSSPYLFSEWSPYGVSYTANVSKVRYNDILYKCIQSHTSQSTWNPKDAASLWTRMDDPTVEWPEWRQPTGSTDAYAKGAKVSHNGKHWVSTLDANVWEPGVSGWEEQKDSDANATA